MKPQNKGKEIAVKDNLRGKNKSGRIWKTVKKRFSSINNVKPLKSTWKKKEEKRMELSQTKEHAKRLKEARNKALREKRERQEENKKRRLENEKKSEIVQSIKNVRKLKRMSKKQFQATIQKR
uniref:Coiled-coil domain-containing protein 86 n=1 Tax=Strigamia maritima TaxID=126957 RepID=T1J5C3_STRMM